MELQIRWKQTLEVDLYPQREDVRRVLSLEESTT